MEEINEFNQIYFVGSNSRKVEAVKGAAHNSGYDDEHGSYIKGQSQTKSSKCHEPTFKRSDLYIRHIICPINIYIQFMQKMTSIKVI